MVGTHKGSSIGQEGAVHRDAAESGGVVGMQVWMRAPGMHRMHQMVKARPQCACIPLATDVHAVVPMPASTLHLCLSWGMNDAYLSTYT